MGTMENTKKQTSHNKKKVIIPILILMLILVIGTSFALWQITLKQTDTNVITSGCLSLVLNEETSAINLTESYPVTDEEGKKLEPYTFTLTNTCEKSTGYRINLETVDMEYDAKWLADTYIRANLTNDIGDVFLDNLSDDYLTEEKVIETFTNAYRINQGVLKSNESKQFSLRVWLDENTPATDEVMNATWQGKITVTATFVNDDLPTIQTIGGDPTYEEAFWNPTYKENISKIIIEDNIHEIDNVIETWNVAEDTVDDTKRVMAYLTPSTTEGLYTLYIQGNGGVKANEDSAAFFGGFTSLESVEGLEHFDTSNVVTMRAMFAACPSLKSLDLSTFDTSNVTDISLMFNECSSLTTLNLNGLNLNQVTEISSLFGSCNNLTTTINITSNNIDSYLDMFSESAIEEGSQITVNYTAETSDLVDQMLTTKSDNSNVIKGTLIS